MTDQTIAEIAGKLTKARRTALWNLGLKPGWQLAPFDGWRRAGLACSGLVAMGLAECPPAGVGTHAAPMYRLTDTGLAVRAYLQEQDG